MAAFDTTRSTFVLVDTTGRIAGHISAVFGALLASVQTWFDDRATHKILSGLDDRALEDIGLTRAELDRLAGR